MVLKQQFSRVVTCILIALLFLGTLMPGAWKDAAIEPLQSPIDLGALAHVGLLAAICFMLPFARFWKVKTWHIPIFGLMLALITEGLQFFAVDRHPNMAGIYLDVAGALLGCMGWRLLTAAGWLALPWQPVLRRVDSASAASSRGQASRPTDT